MEFSKRAGIPTLIRMILGMDLTPKRGQIGAIVSLELRMRNRLAYAGRSRLLQCVLHFPPLECPSRKEDSSVGGLSLFLLVSQGSLLLLAPEREIPPSLSLVVPIPIACETEGKKIEARSILLPPIWQRAKIKGNRGKLGLLLRKKEEERENPERNLEGNLMNT